MQDMEWIETPVVGKMSDSQISQLMHSIEGGGIEEQTREGLLSQINIWKHKQWNNTGHAFGFIPLVEKNKRYISISYAGKIEPDLTLKNKRIKLTMGQLRVADYPGNGNHLILFDFYAINQTDDGKEHLHFNNVFRVMEGQHAPVIGYPIFSGLNVGDEGIQLRCYTVNVKNESDEKFLNFLESDTFKSGLTLLNKSQPAIAPLSKMALSLTQEIAKRNRNVPVQDFYMGLDFSNNGMVAHLREGSYVAVQVPDDFVLIWDWQNWCFDSDTGQIVSTKDRKLLIPYNYIVFNIKRLAE